MTELAKLKQQQHPVPAAAVSSAASSPAAVQSGGTGGQMMMMQQMVNSGVDPFLGPSVMPAAAAGSSVLKSHITTADTGQRNSDTSLGQYTCQCRCYFVAGL